MPAPPARAPLRWALVVPVKVLAHAKTRLAADLPALRPADLRGARALGLGTRTAALAARLGVPGP